MSCQRLCMLKGSCMYVTYKHICIVHNIYIYMYMYVMCCIPYDMYIYVCHIKDYVC